MKTKAYNNISKDIVLAEFKGSDKGYESLLKYYEPYISKLCSMQVKDITDDYVCSFLDEDLAQLMRIAIIKATKKFAKKLI